jgi:hypothetical protein
MSNEAICREIELMPDSHCLWHRCNRARMIGALQVAPNP